MFYCLISGTRNKCSNITRKVNTFWDTDASESELSHVDNTVLQNGKSKCSTLKFNKYLGFYFYIIN